MSEVKAKTVRLGTILQTDAEKGPFMILGNNKNKDPKYDYTVQIRVLQGSPKTPEEFKKATVLYSGTNPLVYMNKPRGENVPKIVKHELAVPLKLVKD